MIYSQRLTPAYISLRLAAEKRQYLTQSHTEECTEYHRVLKRNNRVKTKGALALTSSPDIFVEEQ